jgi:hypothetical protein
MSGTHSGPSWKVAVFLVIDLGLRWERVQPGAKQAMRCCYDEWGGAKEHNSRVRMEPLTAEALPRQHILQYGTAGRLCQCPASGYGRP